MSKSYLCLLSFLLIFSLCIPHVVKAEDFVSLKNLSWEEQKNKTRIILETSKALVYSVVGSQTSSEVEVELENLDLRNLPQELYINTNEVISLQTYPQNQNQKAKIIVKMTAARPHHVSVEGSKLFIDVEGNPQGDGLLAPVTSTLPPQQEKTKLPADPKIEEMLKEASKAPVAEKPEQTEPEAAPQTEVEPLAAITKESEKQATEVKDVKIDQKDASVDVILVGNGTFHYDVFELSNPHRIVVDIKAVSVAPNIRNVTSSGHELFSKVRVAQYQTSPKIARAVIDLNQKVSYTVIPVGNELRIHLGEKDAASDADEILQKDQSQIAGSLVPQGEMKSEPVAEKPAAPTPEVKLPKVESVASAKKADNKKALETPPTVNNEEFFAFKPDTSLFAQETTQEPAPSTQGETTGGQGMGSFQEHTIKSAEKQYTGEPFSFDFKDIDIKDLFRFIADISGLNVILDPNVRGSVTLKLTDVPWDQALDLITKNEGLGYTIEGNVIRIAPLAKIAQEEKARVEAERQQMLSAPLVTKIKPLSYARSADVDRVVKRLLTPKGSSIVDPRTNTIIITDINTNIDAIVNLIDTLDSRTAQVLIEARIVETTKNYSQAFGIQWGFRGIVDPAFGNNTTLQFPNNILADGGRLQSTAGITGNPLGGYAVNLPSNSAPNSAILLSAGNILDTFRLDLALMALENTGNGRILSSPKVATQNNTKAEILQGTQIPVQTIANNTITTTFVNAALRMDVTPQITAEGTVIMEVTVENNRPDFANVVFQTPPIITERASTTLLVEDGGTTVIGGIFTASDQYAQGRTPILHRIPLLGWLFKNTNITRENRELLIFLTPRILR
jgi:type IV pilus secretin PilQ/predicted competence protein